MALYEKTAAELSELLAKKEISAVELAKDVFARTSAVEDKVQGYVTLAEESALQQAEAVDKQRAAGEEVSPEVIQSLKLGLMGPLAGIGDSVDQGIVATIPLAIFVPMALNGSVWAAFMPGLIYLAWSYGWSWFLFQKGYSLGRKAVLEILHSGMIKKVIDIASIVGLFMIGCLSASYVKVTTALTYVNNDTTVALQDTLNGIIPNLLPFCVVMGMYLYITKRGPKYLRLMVYTMVIAIVLTFFGII